MQCLTGIFHQIDSDIHFSSSWHCLTTCASCFGTHPLSLSVFADLGNRICRPNIMGLININPWRTSMLIRIMSTGRCLVFSNIFKNSEVSVFFPLGRPNIMGFMKIDISTHDAVFEKCVMMMYINAGSVGNISCFGSLPHKLPVVLASWRKAFLNSIGMQLKETRDLKNVVFGFCLCRILALSSTKSNSLPSLPVPHL